jgi:acyl carrier protein
MMNLRDDLIERLQQVFRETLNDRSMKITEDTAQPDIPEWESLSQVTLIMAIEREFNIRLTARDASQLVSVRSILDFLEARKQLRPSGRADKE